MSVPSVNIAKERLRTLIIADRIQCTPDNIEKMSADIYQILSKYIELSPEEFKLEFTRSDIYIRYAGKS